MEVAAQGGMRRQRTHNRDSVERRAQRAEQLVQWGELSAARSALEGAPVAPGNDATLSALQDLRKRPPVPRERCHVK